MDASEFLNQERDKLKSSGVMMTGFIVDAKSKSGSRWKIRVPAIHGYADVDGKNKEEGVEVTENDALPFAPAIRGEGAHVSNNDLPDYKQGQFVIVSFTGPNYTNPVILHRVETVNPILGEKDVFTQQSFSILSNEATFAKIDKNAKQLGVATASNGCYKVVPNATYNRDNGTFAGGADKCGAGKIQDGFAANIADFLKIVQDTNGKVGTKFVNKYTGELFEITGYIQKYVSNISALLRSSLQWIKSIITKYVKKAIDKLVKLILQPIKGITKIVNKVLEAALAKIGCSFDSIDKLIENMLTSLLETLANSAINAVFGCLDTLLDGILNEILSEILSLLNSIIASISSIAGIIGGFGDILGQALSAILDFLGIKCGGAGDCTVSGDRSGVNKFNSPGEYGFPSGLKRSLNSGLDGISSLSNNIDTATAKNNAEAYATGVNLGTGSGASISSNNSQLNSAFTTAEGLLGNQVYNTIAGFCNNLKTPTTAVVVGSPVDTYDTTYYVMSSQTDLLTGTPQSFLVRRNNTLSKGVINFVAYLAADDTARVVGITPGLKTGGDINMGAKLASSEYYEDSTNPTRALPVAGNVILSQRVTFEIGEREKTIPIKINTNSPIDSATGSVTYSVGIYRSIEDINNKVYPGLHVPTTSDSLNTTKGIINFTLPAIDPENGKTTPPDPLRITTGDIFYDSRDVSIVAGSDANFIITKSPATDEKTVIKCETYAIDAVDGTNYSGGVGLITFAANQTSAVFVVKTKAIAGLTDIKQFGIKITDVSLPPNTGSNLGGFGYENGTTSTGSGITFVGTINYNFVPVPASGTTRPVDPTNPSPVIPTCPPQIIITAQPPSCIVQPDTIPLNIGLVAKTTVPGYTLNYQWQRTYNPSSGWTNVSNGLFNTTVKQRVTTYGSLGNYTVSGVSYTLSGWTTSVVNTATSTTFTGANTQSLTINPLSYLINDEEYYRCVISGVPSVVSSGTPLISTISETTYVGVTSSGVFLTTVNCSPVAPSGISVVVYSGTTPSVGAPVVPSGVYCIASPISIPATTSGITEEATITTETPPTILPVVPSGLPIIPIPSQDSPEFPILTPIVGPDGDIVSITIPSGLPAYKSPPLIPINGAGFGAVARAELNEDGFIRTIVVKSKGSGYEPTITNLCGILVGVELTTTGAYYEESPTVYIDGDDTIAQAAINEEGRVVEIRITNPQAKVYTTVPRVDIVSTSGIGAAGVAVIQYVDCATVNDEYLRVVNKYNTSKFGTVKVVDCP